jgi:hypothetical protein
MYRPLISFNFSGVPTSTSWLAANVVYHTFYPHEAALLPIVVDNGTNPISDGSPQRLIWQLLMDDFVQGTRGSTAREDQGSIGVASQIVSQGAPQTIPPIDERTGQAITYRRSPCPYLVRRRMPTPPLIPLHCPAASCR